MSVRLFISDPYVLWAALCFCVLLYDLLHSLTPIGAPTLQTSTCLMMPVGDKISSVTQSATTPSCRDSVRH
jgi:hypothetical protein